MEKLYDKIRKLCFEVNDRKQFNKQQNARLNQTKVR